MVAGCLWMVSVPAFASPAHDVDSVSSELRSTAKELVVNGSAAAGVAGWAAKSAGGKVSVRRTRPDDIPAAGGTRDAVRVSRQKDSGDWSFALAALRDSRSDFVPGRTYRMQAWVRDVAGSGAPLGLLLASGGYGHRPTPASVYTHNRDKRWHLLSRTFVCDRPAGKDTALYFDLPDRRGFTFEIAGASVRETPAPLPPTTSAGPTRVVRFDGPRGTRPQPAIWRYETGGNGWGNGEVQTYTSSVKNAQLDGTGHLVITARREDATGPDRIARSFTSARLTTQDTFNVASGSYVEAAVIAPTGAGVWPAFWLAGADIANVGWPAAGELDILEGWGSHPTVAHSAVHLAGRADPHAHRQYGWGEPGGSTDLRESLDARAHRYGVYFDRRVVRFYIDRKPTMTVWAADALAAGSSWPFDRPQHIILNVAVPAGKHSGFPRTMTVGPISVWEGGIPAKGLTAGAAPAGSPQTTRQ